MAESDISVNGRGVIADEWFERAERVPMTKCVTRAVLMSVLSPLEGTRALEIGSGSGAMTVELARAVGSEGRVTSIEISSSAADLTRRNLERAGYMDRVELIEGKAPKSIPIGVFGTVFIGGHGEELEAIMGTSVDRMEAGSRLVLTSITPRSTARALAYLEVLGLGVGFWRMHSSVGARFGSDWLPLGNNPVDIIWGDR
ncbi:MAG: precorrin-6Y C5,15-methyltransferase (decarboxylating) subunit CbiT [Synergistaceae bacterium]|jgi:precorrin-6Y C5,15-methyltransferase (decarboxylating) CbiT subunit|nr:precorrin-6Y C5,15-methyltransferase (decarboxylating) subunit CbiT [Synergistaceae bacterium]